MSEMFSQREIDRIIEDSWHEWQEEEPCKDTISRQEAIDAINRLSIHDFVYEVKTGWIVRDDAVDELMDLQPVTPQPKTAHWIIISPTDMYCSECNEIEHLDTSRRFCAYCGAKMIEPQESEDKK